MKIGIVELGDGKLAGLLKDLLADKIEEADFSVKKALDLFDALAFARQFSLKTDQVVLIAELNPENKDENAAFYNGLAILEEDTGKPVFKSFYSTEQRGEDQVKETAEAIVNYLYHPELLGKQKKTAGGFEFE